MGEWREEIETEFGKSIFESGFKGEVLPSGSFIVDFLVGIGGFPLGSIVEIFGNEGSGKTTLALCAVREALKKKMPVLYEDFEGTVSDSYLEKLGIDSAVIRDYRLAPKSMEDGLMLMKRFCEKHKKGLIVVDSLAAMPPIHDVKKMNEIIGQVKVASMAQVMSVALRQLVNVFREASVCVIFVNQERAKIDMMRQLGGRKTTPGGFAIKFYAALRLQLELRSSIKASEMDILTGLKADKVVGLEVSVNVLKNKFAASYRRGRIYIRMGEGVDNILSAIRIGESLGYVKKERGGYYSFDEKYSGDTLGRKRIHGLERTRNYFVENPKIGYSLMEDVKEALAKKIKQNF